MLLSLFFYVEFCRHKIEQATIQPAQLAFLDAIEPFSTATIRLEQLSAEINTVAWLHLAKLYAKENADIAYQLAQYYLLEKQTNAAVLWYQTAIRKQHVAAHIALANYYYINQRYSDIVPLLLPVKDHDDALILLYKVALQLGNIDFIFQHQEKFANIEQVDFYQELKSFSVFDANNIAPSKQCDIDVQLFATNLEGLRHAQQLINQFQHHQLSRFMCLYTPKYIPKKALNCLHSSHEKISCKASVWEGRQDISSRYLGVIVERGGANVDNGIMYLDQQDDINVLAHELAHFVGFIDEYPLPAQHQKCQQHQQQTFSHNIVTIAKHYHGDRLSIRESILSQLPWGTLIKPTTPILTKINSGWQLITPAEFQNELGVFPAKTCERNANVQAFKPYYARTQLEYFELALPTAYIDILALKTNQFLMPSYHYNVSQDLAKQGEYQRAMEVLRTALFD